MVGLPVVVSQDQCFGVVHRRVRPNQSNRYGVSNQSRKEHFLGITKKKKKKKWKCLGRIEHSAGGTKIEQTGWAIYYWTRLSLLWLSSSPEILRLTLQYYLYQYFGHSRYLQCHIIPLSHSSLTKLHTCFECWCLFWLFACFIMRWLERYLARELVWSLLTNHSWPRRDVSYLRVLYKYCYAVMKSSWLEWPLKFLFLGRIWWWLKGSPIQGCTRLPVWTATQDKIYPSFHSILPRVTKQHVVCRTASTVQW